MNANLSHKRQALFSFSFNLRIQGDVSFLQNARIQILTSMYLVNSRENRAEYNVAPCKEEEYRALPPCGVSLNPILQKLKIDYQSCSKGRNLRILKIIQ